MADSRRLSPLSEADERCLDLMLTAIHGPNWPSSRPNPLGHGTLPSDEPHPQGDREDEKHMARVGTRGESIDSRTAPTVELHRRDVLAGLGGCHFAVCSCGWVSAGYVRESTARAVVCPVEQELAESAERRRRLVESHRG